MKPYPPNLRAEIYLLSLACELIKNRPISSNLAQKWRGNYLSDVKIIFFISLRITRSKNKVLIKIKKLHNKEPCRLKKINSAIFDFDHFEITIEKSKLYSMTLKK